ncbi:protein-tyrosine phosphatase [Frondihabitans sp. PhB188]|uniref:low molecular weight protein-tyrosine-phosphatase n=1 Tax=Frondihabitans sp. PhB188 TaxID=2485200 RepID=UPI000F48454C|nr:low molecular weight protein-tyrosine-phosphatase [Frondihabitans sp. PhB188]ROQ40063.1 protein-tyrosine phosphatase [Frondihabitans sp. PhB188]
MAFEVSAFDEEGDTPPLFRVVFVCTGNICRSPMAEVVFRARVEEAGFGDRVVVGSRGTGDWHVGEHADARTVAALQRRGYDGSRHRARQFEAADYDRHDLVVVFDRGQERILRGWAPTEADRSKVQLLLSFDRDAATGAGDGTDVPDPYYSDAAMFETVLDMVEHASTALFRQIEPALRQGSTT